MHSWAVRLRKSRWAEPIGVAFVMVLALAGSAAEAYPRHHYGGLHLRGRPDVASFALLALPAAALLWRRRRPVLVYIAAVAGVAAWAALGEVDGAALVVVLVALYSLAVGVSKRTTVVAFGAAGLLTIWVAGGLRGPWGWWGGPQLDMWGEMLAAGAFGAYVATRRQWKASEHRQREQEDRSREEETRRRVDSERLRIARELHDVVAHSMAMINVQATAAALVLSEDRAQVAEALQAIRRASKDGLRELRAILDVLRQVDSDDPAVPVPGTDALHALAKATTAAGVPTLLHVDDALPPLPAGVALAAYRIVQESLTNVIRHASQASATVSVVHQDGLLLVEIVDDGTIGRDTFVDGSGTGISGMTERAAALGGTLQAGPLNDGGFAVRAALPTLVLESDPTRTDGPPGSVGPSGRGGPGEPESARDAQIAASTT